MSETTPTDEMKNAAREALVRDLVDHRVPNPLAEGSANDIELSGLYSWPELQRFADAILASPALDAIVADAVAAALAPVERLADEWEHIGGEYGDDDSIRRADDLRAALAESKGGDRG